MASDDFENGVWRTIGGRHIFIRDGESVSSAMKRSGKFKSAKKKIKDEEEKSWRDKIKDKNERNEILDKELDKSTKSKAKDFWEKEDNLTKEIDEKNNEKEAERMQDGKSNDEMQLVNMGDGKYIPVRKGEKVEDVVKQFNEREKNYREGLKSKVSAYVSGRVAGLWDQDVVDAYIEMNEKGMFTGDDKDLITRDMKNMGGEPIYSPDRLKQSNGMKEINDKIADNKTIKQLNKEMLGNTYKGKGQTPNLIYSNDRRIDIDNQGHATIWKDGKIERKTILPDNVSGDKTKDYFDKYLKDLDDMKNSNNQINNAIRRKAYQKYLKEHPASKMTFEDFKDMSKMQ